MDLTVRVCCSLLLLVPFAIATLKDNNLKGIKNKRELLPVPFSGGASQKYLPPSIANGGGEYSRGSSHVFSRNGYNSGYGPDIGHGNGETYIIQTSRGKSASLRGGEGFFKYPSADSGVTLGNKEIIPSESYRSPSVSFGNDGSSYSGGHGNSISGSSYTATYSPTYGNPSVNFNAQSSSYSSGLGSSGSHYYESNSPSIGGGEVLFGGPSSHGGSVHGSVSHYTPKHTSTPSSTYGALQLSSLSNKYLAGSLNLVGDASRSSNYASGQKGLGHFAYSPSKPSTLNTEFVSSSGYNGEFSGPHVKAPFKPSAFLGSSQNSKPSNHYLPTSYEYLPPSHSYSSSPSAGIEGGASYQVPSTVYGAPSGSGFSQSNFEHATPVHDSLPYSGSDNNNYVNSEQIYEVPPSKSYLPPTSIYGTPTTSYGTPNHQ